jgi:phosphoribosylglycinamide formyltransferase 1
MVEAGIPVSLIATDRPCRALDLAATLDVPSLFVDRLRYGGFKDTFNREEYTQTLTEGLVAREIDVVAMAGFGTILTGTFHEAFPGRVLNTHPSLLPAFKGWHAVRQALESGANETGCTVHIATEALDDGPILAQRRVPILENDDEASLHERIKVVERTLYPMVVGRVMASLREGFEPSSIAGTLEEE